LIEKKTTIFNDKEYVKTKLFPSWKMILNKDIEGDEETAKVVQKYLNEMPKDSSEKIGLVLRGLNSRTDSVRSKETNMANLFCDALKETFNSDIGFVSGGAVRGDSFYYPGSQFTKGDMDKESPFPNQCKVVKITGKMFLESVEFVIIKTLIHREFQNWVKLLEVIHISAKEFPLNMIIRNQLEVESPKQH
jgi:2',3'-cyclic-nucleotide 2'-phosphodiesterase (5'-nucleotidase family)